MFFFTYARFAPGVPISEALRRATEVAREVDPVRTAKWSALATPLDDVQLDRYYQRAVPMLTGGVVLLFLVLCSNVSTLLLTGLTTRGRELGTRAALGASPGNVRRLVWHEGVSVMAIGISAGAIAGAMLARALTSLLYNVETRDPVSWAIVAMMLALTVAAASWYPSRTAVRAAPIALLRED
jgi:ABC-type antimicrobial peptide transport system permease subunit